MGGNNYFCCPSNLYAHGGGATFCHFAASLGPSSLVDTDTLPELEDLWLLISQLSSGAFGPLHSVRRPCSGATLNS